MKPHTLTLAILAACTVSACAADTEDTTGVEVGEADLRAVSNTGCVATVGNGDFRRIEFTRPDRAVLSTYSAQGRLLEDRSYEYSVQRDNDGSLAIYSGGTSGALEFRVKKAARGYTFVEERYVTPHESPASCDFTNPAAFPPLPVKLDVPSAPFSFPSSADDVSCVVKSTGAAGRVTEIQIGFNSAKIKTYDKNGYFVEERPLKIGGVQADGRSIVVKSVSKGLSLFSRFKAPVLEIKKGSGSLVLVPGEELKSTFGSSPVPVGCELFDPYH